MFNCCLKTSPQVNEDPGNHSSDLEENIRKRSIRKDRRDIEQLMREQHLSQDPDDKVDFSDYSKIEKKKNLNKNESAAKENGNPDTIKNKVSASSLLLVLVA